MARRFEALSLHDFLNQLSMADHGVKATRKIVEVPKAPKTLTVKVKPTATENDQRKPGKTIDKDDSTTGVDSAGDVSPAGGVSPVGGASPVPPVRPNRVPQTESAAGKEPFEKPAAVGSTNGSTSGYGSEGYISEEANLKKVETGSVLDIRDDQTHCARCHKTFDPLSNSNAEKRCLLPHPTKMVIPIRRDLAGTHFVCLCCRTEFKLPKMTFYEAGVNSMMTGHCYIGQHTSDSDDIDYQYDGGAALSCEEAGCIEFFV